MVGNATTVASGWDRVFEGMLLLLVTLSMHCLLLLTANFLCALFRHRQPLLHRSS